MYFGLSHPRSQDLGDVWYLTHFSIPEMLDNLLMQLCFQVNVHISWEINQKIDGTPAGPYLVPKTTKLAGVSLTITTLELGNRFQKKSSPHEGIAKNP